MMIESIEIEIDITDALGALDPALAEPCHWHYGTRIETILQQWGEPLRWAITAVDRETNIAQIEAIVIKESGVAQLRDEKYRRGEATPL